MESRWTTSWRLSFVFKLHMGGHWKNFYRDNCVHHVTCTVHKWQQALLFPRITQAIYSELYYSIIRWHISVVGYVIMPEHFHALLVSEEGLNIQKALHGLRRRVSGVVHELIDTRNSEFIIGCAQQKININLFFSGTCSKSEFRFWKEKPRVFPVDLINEVHKKLDYIHNNPMRRGLIDDPAKWEHSSLKAHLNNMAIDDYIENIFNERYNKAPGCRVLTLHPDA